MKTVHNNILYDSDKCEILASRLHYSHSNNYSGTTYIVRAKNGVLLTFTESNGQDCYLTDEFGVLEAPLTFDGYRMSDAEEARCVELGLIITAESDIKT